MRCEHRSYCNYLISKYSRVLWELELELNIHLLSRMEIMATCAHSSHLWSLISPHNVFMLCVTIACKIQQCCDPQKVALPPQSPVDPCSQCRPPSHHGSSQALHTEAASEGSLSRARSRAPLQRACAAVAPAPQCALWPALTQIPLQANLIRHNAACGLHSYSSQCILQAGRIVRDA